MMYCDILDTVREFKLLISPTTLDISGWEGARVCVLKNNNNNWQAAKEVWYNTLNESFGSWEVETIGHHWVSKPK